MRDLFSQGQIYNEGAVHGTAQVRMGSGVLSLARSLPSFLPPSLPPSFLPIFPPFSHVANLHRESVLSGWRISSFANSEMIERNVNASWIKTLACSRNKVALPTLTIVQPSEGQTVLSSLFEGLELSVSVAGSQEFDIGTECCHILFVILLDGKVLSQIQRSPVAQQLNACKPHKSSIVLEGVKTGQHTIQMLHRRPDRLEHVKQELARVPAADGLRLDPRHKATQPCHESV
eukprot:750533-Hanusia_phi.AAC.3